MSRYDLFINDPKATQTEVLFEILNHLLYDETEWANLVLETVKRIRSIETHSIISNKLQNHCRTLFHNKKLYHLLVASVFYDVAEELKWIHPKQGILELTQSSPIPNLSTNLENLLNTTQSRNPTLIYVLTVQGQLFVALDSRNSETGSLVSERLTHSQLALGLPVYAAGEIEFICESEAEPLVSETSEPISENASWKIKMINNGSGHYQPEFETLDTLLKCLQFLLPVKWFHKDLQIQTMSYPIDHN